MSVIQAVFEKGVFRPVGPVQLPEGTRVFVETEEKAVERIRAARQRIVESLSRSYDTGEPGNILETHNDHQP
jgi:predicted DNA-binding antitoxin AbrB/MazE fold protein